MPKRQILKNFHQEKALLSRQDSRQLKNTKKLIKVFPELHDPVVQIYSSGNKHTVVEFVSSGTEPDHVKFELAVCFISTIENGIITKDFTYFNNFDETKIG